MKRAITFVKCTLLSNLLMLIPLFSQPDTLTIIHVNDTHSNLLPYAAGEYGGMARAASVIGQWKMSEPNPVLLHGGDFMVGTLMFNAYFGVPELQILNSLGFDALALGNHEFDFGSDNLGMFLSLAQVDSSFDFICTNALNLDSVPALDAMVRPYAIEQRGNVKMGIIGLTTPEANITSNPLPVVLSQDLVMMTLQNVAQLQGMGCQVIIILSHLGHALDLQIAPYLSGVNAIIGAHSHTVMTDVAYVNGIPIVQAGEFYHYVGKLRLIYDGSATSVLDYTLQEITPAIPAEPNVDNIIQVLKQGVIAQYTPIIGDPYQPITFAPYLLNAYPQAFDTLDSPMGNLITTAMLDYVSGAHCALEPNGHIVEELYPGPVTPADIFRAYPYGYDTSPDLGFRLAPGKTPHSYEYETSDGLGFRLASYDLYGGEILGVLQALLGLIDPVNGSWDFLIQSTGMCYTVNPTPQGLQLGEVFINGSPVNPGAVYTVVSSDRVVGYLDSLFGITPANLTIYPISVFQVAKEYVETIATLQFTSTGCIRVCFPGLLGDVDGDDQVNSSDGLLGLTYEVRPDLIPQPIMERINIGFGDADENGLTNSTDALIILSYDAGIPTPFPVGNSSCLTNPTVPAPAIPPAFSAAKAGEKILVSAAPQNGDIASGEMVDIPVMVDMSNLPEKLGSFTAALEWDPAALQFVGYRGGRSAGFEQPVVNDTKTQSGKLIFANANPAGSEAGERVNILNLKFKALRDAHHSLSLTFSAMAAAETFTDLLPYLEISDQPREENPGGQDLPEFSGLDNYPNPFNPETKISFALNRSNQVALEIYDLLGRKVRTLVNEHLSAGEYTFTWNGRDDRGRLVTSGVYFYRLTGGAKQTVKRMLLLR